MPTRSGPGERAAAQLTTFAQLAGGRGQRMPLAPPPDLQATLVCDALYSPPRWWNS
jgi:hypothetical protein